ncbi:MAG TPA: hypothetical protein PLA43_07765 [Bryobacteraceae bacterium]|nr:hypothetical protein [Bryobacteraceae bacterium]HOL69882.1 hypothetical protein [Bryobacteraceae bacterium]HOQ43719.1 hypothetical protein [Bryobacteraceae bacterium]HPQ16557.1 hypothetical protein [Bryobacteraceae bacterium]HPU71838.1 hypothetical protein [Bryobacteraceae bacterium]
MSVRPESSGGGFSLRGSEGELVIVRIAVEPRLLERLLDVLARLDFPINPQIYHDAERVYVDSDGVERVAPAAVVEFPAWAARMEAVREALDREGLNGANLTVRNMFEDIRSDSRELPAAPGATVVRYRAVRVA